MKKSRKFKEGEVCRIVYKIHSFISDDLWEKEYHCAKCKNNKWQISYRTGTKINLGKEVKVKCTECGRFFITKETLLSKVLGSIQ